MRLAEAAAVAAPPETARRYDVHALYERFRLAAAPIPKPPADAPKRVPPFAEWLDTHTLEQVSHAQFVFTTPKLLRPIFKSHPRDLRPAP